MSRVHNLNNGRRRAITTWLFLGIIILFVIVVRVRLLDVPLERDEGEYAYMGQLLLQGIPPYSEAYNMKFPGAYLMYAAIMSLFGQTTQGIHLGFMLLNCATVLLIFYLGRKIVRDTGALVASAAYAALSLSSSVLGFAAHATHFVILPALGGILLLLHAFKKEKLHLYFFSGALLGLSFLMKQPGIFFFLFSAFYIIYNHVSSGSAGPPARQLTDLPANKPAGLQALFLKLFVLSFGAALPLIIVAVWLYVVGVFDTFWFWCVEYASKYASRITISQAPIFLRESFILVADGFFIVWLLSALGLVSVFLNKELKGSRVFLLMFTVFSFLSICPGFIFRQHYYVTLLPAVSLLVGIFVDYSDMKIAASFKSPYLRFAGLVIFIVAILTGIVSQKEYLFQDGPVKVSRTFYGQNPFPEAVEIAKFLKSASSASDKIAILGSEPEIFFYSKRHSATGYIYVYGLMEIHQYSLRMQREMINEIESSRPKFIVLVQVDTSWLIRKESERYIFNWLENYLSRNYYLVGVADTVSEETTIYKWYTDAARYVIRSPYHTLVFERR
jgi:hypothetical protein